MNRHITYRGVTIESGAGTAKVWWTRKQLPEGQEVSFQYDTECANFRSRRLAEAFIDLALSHGSGHEARTTNLPESGAEFGYISIGPAREWDLRRAFTEATGRDFPATASDERVREQERRERRRFSHRSR
jgi:hypothetical protein